MKNFIVVLRIFLGLSFLFSSYTKLIAPGFFEITLLDQGLASSRDFAAHMTRFFIGLEFSLGILIILPYLTKSLMLFSGGLLSAFTIHLVYLILIGDNENCGCFGEMISMTPSESIVKNIILIFATFFVYKKSSEKRISILIPNIFMLLTILSMWFIIPIPNNKNFPFQKYSNFIPSGRIDLAEKEGLVAIFNLDCDHCQEAAIELSIMKKKHEAFPKVFVLYFKEGSTSVKEFEKISGSQFPYTLIDVNSFFDLIGDSPPRIYYINNGKVIKIWDDNFTDNIKSFFDLKG
ncbi:MAG: hypothetical protein P8M03_06020 [Flavobacteriaceae bacterium]|nr:hypothetical protein [Flavobacteriaceae bacterium]